MMKETGLGQEMEIEGLWPSGKTASAGDSRSLRPLE